MKVGIKDYKDQEFYVKGKLDGKNWVECDGDNILLDDRELLAFGKDNKRLSTNDWLDTHGMKIVAKGGKVAVLELALEGAMARLEKLEARIAELEGAKKSRSA